VRSATGTAVTETNSHPFRFGRYLWMHNGSLQKVNEWRRTVRSAAQSCPRPEPGRRPQILSQLSSTAFKMIEGTTDSELAGAVFVDMLPRAPGEEPDPWKEISVARWWLSGGAPAFTRSASQAEELANTMTRTLAMLMKLGEEASESRSGADRYASSRACAADIALRPRSASATSSNTA
jgi:hypothetical protein